MAYNIYLFMSVLIVYRKQSEQHDVHFENETPTSKPSLPDLQNEPEHMILEPLSKKLYTKM